MNEAFLIKDLSYKNYIVQTDKKNGTAHFLSENVPSSYKHYFKR